MADAPKTVGTRRTPQNRPADATQHRNDAGGYVFEAGLWSQVHRFLTLGITGPTYYVGERKLAEDALALVQRAINEDGPKLVGLIREISTAGRAPRPQSALYALAAASALGDEETRKLAYAALSAVARTGTHLFTFAEYRAQFAGWSRGYRTAVANWYLGRNVDAMTYQMVKYRQRDGWDHRRLLQTSHPTPDTAERDAVWRWVLGKPQVDEETLGEEGTPELPSILVDFLDAQAVPANTVATSNAAAGKWADIITRGHGLSWEMLPTEALKRPEVWTALIHQGLPITALIRQLPRLTNLGLTTGDTGRLIRQRLESAETLKRGRVHPINVLVAARTYRSGVGRGQSWTSDAKILDSLDRAFYESFGAVRPSGKRLLLALDVSGSMGMQAMDTMGGLTPREAAAALSLVQMATETDYEIVGFTGPYGGRRAGMLSRGGISRLVLSPRQRLDDAVKYTAGLGFGPTDCALPMLWALKERIDVDAIVIYTDNQTWAGQIHPHQALKNYRSAVGHDVALMVVAMQPPMSHTIADPRDPRTLDVSGFDAAVPNLIADFARGDVG